MSLYHIAPGALVATALVLLAPRGQADLIITAFDNGSGGTRWDISGTVDFAGLPATTDDFGWPFNTVTVVNDPNAGILDSARFDQTRDPGVVYYQRDGGSGSAQDFNVVTGVGGIDDDNSADFSNLSFSSSLGVTVLALDLAISGPSIPGGTFAKVFTASGAGNPGVVTFGGWISSVTPFNELTAGIYDFGGYDGTGNESAVRLEVLAATPIPEASESLLVMVSFLGVLGGTRRRPRRS